MNKKNTSKYSDKVQSVASSVDIQKLALLAHVNMSKNELKNLEQELPNILDFVEQVQQANCTLEKKTGEHYNIMREDGEGHDGEMYSQDLIKAMPESKNGYLKVNKIIDNS